MHLNPVRAKLVEIGDGLSAYPWSSLVWYAAAREHRPDWIRVDRLLGEHGIGEDSAAGRGEFERRMEARRREETEEPALEALRRGWCLGSEAFKQQTLERMEGRLGEHHSGGLRQESGEVKAERIIAGELSRLGWSESDLAGRRKSDPGKLALAARLRVETTLPLKWIAKRVWLGTSKSANAKLHLWMKANGAPAWAQEQAGDKRAGKHAKTNQTMG